MPLSVLEIFKIGIGPSSSHTVGPMRAARQYVLSLQETGLLDRTRRVKVELFGSLGATGRGHGSDKAILLGLEGAEPETVAVEGIEERLSNIRKQGALRLLAQHMIPFEEKSDLILHLLKSLPSHPNGMRFSAFDGRGELLDTRDYYSVGGGFIIDAAAAEQYGDAPVHETSQVRYPFSSGAELLAQCRSTGLNISSLALQNESLWRSSEDTCNALAVIWQAMQACVERGCGSSGNLPGNLRVRRRAPEMYQRLTKNALAAPSDPLSVLDWVNLFALAVNEENASGGRVVTAPTNGAAGIVPAVMHYYARFVAGANEDGAVRFLLTAGAIAMLYKRNASISGAEVGCQGEVGVACSIAAGALAEACGGTPEQVENAAEIGMEHNLGLTCDPVGGLVQIPCIERNAMGAVKAINAARIALQGDGHHFVTLDKVIRTMRETGADMMTKYKETSLGGLAVNVVEC